jgi:TRAP-type transport system periplasmic protein
VNDKLWNQYFPRDYTNRLLVLTILEDQLKKSRLSLATCFLTLLVLVIFLTVTACSGSTPTPTTPPKTTAPASTSAPATSAPPASSAAPTSTTPAAATSPASSGKITIKAVSFQPKTATVLKPFATYISLISDKSKGDITINWAGGADVIPAFDQGGAVRDGVVDMAVLPTSYFSQLNAAVFGTAIQSQFTPMEEYTNGVYDFMNSEANKVNLRLVGRLETNQTFHIGVKKPVTTYKDLSGKKIRDAVLFSSFLKALGCVPVTVAPTEAYTSLDRGVVDGYNFPYSDVSDLSIFEVCKYFIDHTVYESGNLVIIMNNKTFSAYPKDKQDLIINTLKDYMPQLAASYADTQAAAKKKMIAGGMTAIKFSDADAKAYRELAYSSFADGIKAQVPADTFTKIMQIVTKK